MDVKINWATIAIQMKKLAVLMLLCAPMLQAQVVHHSFISRAGNYISHHKELLAADTVVFGGEMAMALTSTCDHEPKGHPKCVETDPLVFGSPHPSGLEHVGTALMMSTFEITGMHLAWHFAPEPTDRHLIWFGAIPLAAFSAQDAARNARIDGARLRLEQSTQQ